MKLAELYIVAGGYSVGAAGGEATATATALGIEPDRDAETDAEQDTDTTPTPWMCTNHQTDHYRAPTWNMDTRQAGWSCLHASILHPAMMWDGGMAICVGNAVGSLGRHAILVGEPSPSAIRQPKKRCALVLLRRQ
ncbi:hypothetical protein G7046_g7999 [Stylonectria norvegica]|nr:hypothetical protein G7046_g7999 [Stylonectria norvegica]